MAARSPPLASSPASNPNYIPMSLDRQQSAAGTMNSNRNSGYFPQTPPPAVAQDQTHSNTLANSNHHHHQPAAHHPPPSEPNNSLSAPANQGRFTEEWDASQRGSSIIDGPLTGGANMQRSNSFASSSGEDHLNLPSRKGTLKKKASLRRSGSLKRSGSRRSMKAGSVRSLALQSTSDPDEAHSAFHCPVPTTGNPTEVLASRFQSWRKILKDLIAYYREIQNNYEQKSKSLIKLANVANNISTPPGFLTTGGLEDALHILRNYNKQAITEANKAREIEEDVILALTGLRSDIHQKIKEIKNLSGDFKNSVEKEMENTRRLVKTLQESLGQSELDSALTTGKQDPYLLRLAVDKQVERQIDEENYLHQAYLNLESSGRELESIVVGEIQKAYNAYAGIMKRESDAAYAAIDELRIGPVSMPKDNEWLFFVQKDDHFVNPDVPIRSAEHIHYPGRDHLASQEIRAGLLERKSKYLKSYTAGWYVLSPTHLHEFKSADKAQAPVMSLYLPEQKLGSHSSEGGSSNKFILKGRQTGSMHRGHTWVFRAESHDTMMAWYEDIKVLTEKTPQERSEFVRGHSRSMSQSSRRSISSDGVVDEDDDEPFAADTAVSISTGSKTDVRRPQPGGRFPSDIQVNAQRGLQAPLSPSSVSSDFVDKSDREAFMAASALPGSGVGENNYATRESYLGYGGTQRTPMEEVPSHAAIVSQQAREDGVNPYTSEHFRNPHSTNTEAQTLIMPTGGVQRAHGSQGIETPGGNAQYGEWMSGRAPQNTSNIPNGDYYAAGGRSTGDVTVAPVMGNGHVPSAGHSQKTATQQDWSARPTSGTVRTDSVPTISNLHIPGEFPKATPTTEGYGKQL